MTKHCAIFSESLRNDSYFKGISRLFQTSSKLKADRA